MTDEAIDYKSLLHKYMRHVLDDAGLTFCDRLNDDHLDVEFTPLEKAALENMAEEIES